MRNQIGAQAMTETSKHPVERVVQVRRKGRSEDVVILVIISLRPQTRLNFHHEGDWQELGPLV